MEIDGNTKLDDLLNVHPFLLEFLVNRSPAFKKLANPLLRKTVGKVASLAQVAVKADIGLDTLVAEIATEIAAQTDNRGADS